MARENKEEAMSRVQVGGDGGGLNHLMEMGVREVCGWLERCLGGKLSGEW